MAVQAAGLMIREEAQRPSVTRRPMWSINMKRIGVYARHRDGGNDPDTLHSPVNRDDFRGIGMCMNGKRLLCIAVLLLAASREAICSICCVADLKITANSTRSILISR